MTIKGLPGEVIGPTKHFIGLRQAGEIMGIGYTTVRIYHSEGKLPAAQVVVGQSPGWDKDYFTDWAKARAEKIKAAPKGRRKT